MEALVGLDLIIILHGMDQMEIMEEMEMEVEVVPEVVVEMEGEGTLVELEVLEVLVGLDLIIILHGMVLMEIMEEMEMGVAMEGVEEMVEVEELVE